MFTLSIITTVIVAIGYYATIKQSSKSLGINLWVALPKWYWAASFIITVIFYGAMFYFQWITFIVILNIFTVIVLFFTIKLYKSINIKKL